MSLAQYYKENKLFRRIVKVVLLIAGLFVAIFLTFIPITNSKYQAQLFNLTKDEGYEAVMAINLDDAGSVAKGKKLLKDRIHALESLEVPKSSAEILFNFSAEGIDSEKKNAYVSVFKKFSESPFWKYWEESESMWGIYKEKQHLLEQKRNELSKELYVTPKSQKLYDEVTNLTKEVDQYTQRFSENQRLAEENYTLFKKHLAKLYEKYY